MAAYFVQGRVAGVIWNNSIREGGFPIYGKMQIILVSMDRYISKQLLLVVPVSNVKCNFGCICCKSLSTILIPAT
jgi:hypothetical protein